jgi:hypothetical protein
MSTEWPKFESNSRIFCRGVNGTFHVHVGAKVTYCTTMTSLERLTHPLAHGLLRPHLSQNSSSVVHGDHENSTFAAAAAAATAAAHPWQHFNLKHHGVSTVVLDLEVSESIYRQTTKHYVVSSNNILPIWPVGIGDGRRCAGLRVRDYDGTRLHNNDAVRRGAFRQRKVHESPGRPSGEVRVRRERRARANGRPAVGGG